MGRSVLLVDDDAGFRSLAAEILRTWGHDVVGQAGTVAEAVERAAELRPDTVLADIGLPDGDGFELARLLRALPWQPRVVLTSSDGDRSNCLAARRAGASGFFPKDEVFGHSSRQMIEG